MRFAAIRRFMECQQMLSLHAGSAVTAAFLAAMVEAVEAMTIVLAVAVVRGWRPAGLGAGAGLALLALIVLALGPLLDRAPLAVLQIAIGILLLLFGMRWLRKAILRAAGIIPLHDEASAFASETAELRDQARHHAQRLDWFAGLASFKAVLLEGLEVVFIVVAVSAGRGTLVPVSAAAAAACLLVALVGLVIHQPLARSGPARALASPGPARISPLSGSSRCSWSPGLRRWRCSIAVRPCRHHERARCSFSRACRPVCRRRRAGACDRRCRRHCRPDRDASAGSSLGERRDFAVRLPRGPRGECDDGEAAVSQRRELARLSPGAQRGVQRCAVDAGPSQAQSSRRSRTGDAAFHAASHAGDLMPSSPADRPPTISAR